MPNHHPTLPCLLVTLTVEDEDGPTEPADHHHHEPETPPKRVVVKDSKIPGAGRALFAATNFKADEVSVGLCQLRFKTKHIRNCSTVVLIICLLLAPLAATGCRLVIGQVVTSMSDNIVEMSEQQWEAETAYDPNGPQRLLDDMMVRCL